MTWALSDVYTMSEEQLSALLAKLKDDAGLQEKLKGAADLGAAIAIANEAGFDVTEADWLKHQANNHASVVELGDEALEGVAGGASQELPTLPFDTQGCYGCQE